MCLYHGLVSRAKYHSARRQEQAEATRKAILDAARDLFIERSYARTTIADIATAAHVAVPTVYVSVGTKPAILGELRKLIPPRLASPMTFGLRSTSWMTLVRSCMVL